jgi:hypothetical protein
VETHKVFTLRRLTDFSAAKNFREVSNRLKGDLDFAILTLDSGSLKFPFDKYVNKLICANSMKVQENQEVAECHSLQKFCASSIL